MSETTDMQREAFEQWFANNFPLVGKAIEQGRSPWAAIDVKAIAWSTWQAAIESAQAELTELRAKVARLEAPVSEGMTLEHMADDLQAIIDGERPRLNKSEMCDYVRDLRAHLSKSAQAVDVGAIREVIESHVDEAKKLRHDPESQDYLHEQADKLTRALSGEKAGR